MTNNDSANETSPFDSPVETPATQLVKVKSVLSEHMEIKDWEAVYIILATAVSHYYPGEPIWLRFIGASRSGKTELLRALSDHPDTEKMEVLTPAALRGGLKGGGLKGGKRLLERLDGKLVITKETSQILTTSKDVRNQVFGLLRGIKDGELVSDFGSEEGHLEQKASFDWILGATAVIEQQRTMDSMLGARFIDLHWYSGSREETAMKAMENNRDLPRIRLEIKTVFHQLLDTAKDNAASPIELDGGLGKWIVQIANVTAVLRTAVQKDSQHHITVMPEPEFPTELAQGFSRIAGGLKLLGLDRKVYLLRLAVDCIPRIRVTILASIKRGKLSPSGIATSVGLPAATVEYHLEDLIALGVLAKNSGSYFPKIDLTPILPTLGNSESS